MGETEYFDKYFWKISKDIFSEFDGKDYDELVFDGDVKYHMGWTSQIDPNNDGKKLILISRFKSLSLGNCWCSCRGNSKS